MTQYKILTQRINLKVFHSPYSVPKMLMGQYETVEANEAQKLFFKSVREAMGQGISATDLLWMIALLALAFGFGFLTKWVYESRYEIRRRAQHIFLWIIRKRKSLEFRKRIRAKVFVTSPQTGEILERYSTLNLSPGGMFIRTNRPYAQNTSFDFILKIGNDVKINGIAIVRWVQKEPRDQKPIGMGCEFTGLSDTDRNQIRLGLRKS